MVIAHKKRRGLKKRLANSPAQSTIAFKKPFTGTKVEGVLHFDGSCNPNPGLAQCGFVLHVGTRIVEETIDLGDGTNNTAEYGGLINGLRASLREGVTHLEVYGDSRIVIGGMQKGPWKKGMPHIERLKAEALELAKQFHSVEYEWVPRESNVEADNRSRTFSK